MFSTFVCSMIGKFRIVFAHEFGFGFDYIKLGFLKFERFLFRFSRFTEISFCSDRGVDTQGFKFHYLV